MWRIRYALLTAALVTGLAGSAEAQSPYKWYLEGFFSFTTVRGDFANIVTSGYGGGGQVAYVLPSSIWIMGGFSVLALNGEAGLFNWTNYNVFADVGYNLTRGSSFGDAVLFGGIGATNFNPDSDTVESNTYFAVNGGFKLALNISERVAVPINLAASYVFTDDSSTGKGVWFIPFTVGLGVRF